MAHHSGFLIWRGLPPTAPKKGEITPISLTRWAPATWATSKHKHSQSSQIEALIWNTMQFRVHRTRVSCTCLPDRGNAGLCCRNRTMFSTGYTKKQAILCCYQYYFRMNKTAALSILIIYIQSEKLLETQSLFSSTSSCSADSIIKLIIICFLQLMLYPPKKRAYSPELTKTKDLANLPNINSKFTGSGGNTSSLAPKKQMSVPKPAVSGIFKAEKKLLSEPTLFRKYYERGDLPIAVSFNGALRKLTWKMEPEHLDYHLHLPIFFEGIREVEEPYRFLACQGVDQLIERNPNKLLPVLPQLIIPIKKALSTKDHEVVCIALKKIQKLVLAGEMIGEALVPYYRQILPVFNMFKNKRLNIGDKIDYAQRKNENLSELIQETLEVLQKHGGEDAYINIKYMIPTYESCMF